MTRASRKPAKGSSGAAGAGRKGKSSELMATPQKTSTVAITDLVRDPDYQVRAELDDATIHRYANALAADCIMPPIRVAKVNGSLIVVDGWHRLAAYDLSNTWTVEAIIIEATAGEARWMAAKANLTNGLPLRKAEIREAFRTLIQTRQHVAKPTQGAMKPGTLLSYRDLAQMLGGLVRHNTIRGWMMKDFPRIARRMGGEDAAYLPREACRDDEKAPYNAALAAVANAVTNAAQVRDPGRRWDMIEALQGALDRVRAGGEAELREF